MLDPEIVKLAQFWGKARPAEGGDVTMHPLMAHMLDVAAVAMELPLGRHCGLDIRLVGFLVALHDIGKLSPAFQGKVKECCPSFLPEKTTVSRNHASVTLQLLIKWFDNEKSFTGSLVKPLIVDHFENKTEILNLLCQILGGVAGHHGVPTIDEDGRLDDLTIAYAERLTVLLLDIFQPPPFTPDILEHLREVEWRLAALTIQADWVGSRQEWFPYVVAEMLHDPKKYFQEVSCHQARRAVEKAGLSTVPVSEFDGIGHLFPEIKMPSPLQLLLETVPLPEGPVLVVIEDMTGSGKTEAALTVAHRLMEKMAATHEMAGLFVGLPTMATANAMYKRLAKAYRGLFCESARPSLALAHGRADMNGDFREAIVAEDFRDKGDPDTAESCCASWLAGESRRALMAQVGVGTIDQALLSVLPVRYATIRQAGLAHKVLLIDECHAFDSYMNEEICALLRFHAALGGSAILLSATLTKALRQRLVNAFQSGCGDKDQSSLKCDAYPLVTIAGPSGPPLELPCALRPGLERTIRIVRLDTLRSAEEVLLSAYRKGAACCWIRNMVDDVIQTARALGEQGEDVTVFHARFAMIDRLEVEKKIIARFGKKSKGTERTGLLIASQVIEQSLDLDFDVLCTDLAPMDLILQRAGRLRRHHRESRPVDKDELYVLSPKPVPEPDPSWVKSFLPGTAAVYRDPALLWRTARVLFRCGVVSLPGDMRSLIEEVADNTALGAVPPALEYAANEKEGDDMAGARMGRQNTLRFDDGYKPDDLLWGTEQKTPTRLETGPSIILRLAFEKDGMVLPWAVRKGKAFSSHQEKHEAWAFSEVSVRRNRLTEVMVPDHLAESVQKARSGWSRWERDDDENYLLLVLELDGGAWHGKGVDENGRDVFMHYSEYYGLEFRKGRK
ncbi:CRISPR-associated helicase Cas3' [Acetobacteraceae bacterium ESL0709]|nr:CRISPR-associated helicase Cas3' [Acetobacteraceae bacterium ESL0697]MDF7677510.1 CRISPR-associated helicase Cas3' [Acetobacteraceae bacterium ESL0709]